MNDMETFLVYLAKTSVSVAAFFLLYLLFFQKKSYFRFNRLYLLVSMTVSFLIPFITIRVEVPQLPVVVTFPEATANMVVPAGTSSSGNIPDWEIVLFYFILAGMMAFLLNFSVSCIKAWKIIRNGERKHFNGISYRVSAENIHPFSFFNQIVIPSEITGKNYFPLVLEHEFVHVKEKHTIDVFVAELLFLFQWFNPFAWLMKNVIKTNLEYLTDDLVIQKADQQNYQLAMVALAGKNGIAPFLTALNGSQLKNRIMMMKQKTKKQKQMMKKLMTIPLLILLIATLSNKEFRAATLPQDKTAETVSNPEAGYRMISGKVVSAPNHSPEENAVIMTTGIIENGQRGTLTDASGNFNFRVDDQANEIVVVSLGKNFVEIQPDRFTNGIVVTMTDARDNDKKEIEEVYKKFVESLTVNKKEDSVRIISGKVKDDKGTAISGASVMIKGKPVGTITDRNGNYMLKTGSEDQILVFSKPGYESVEIAVDGKNEIDVQLKKAKDAPTAGSKNMEIWPVKGSSTHFFDSETDSVEKVFFIDGKKVNSIDHFAIENVENVEVFTGDKAGGGTKKMVMITTKDQKKEVRAPLFIVDGKNMGKTTIKKLAIDPDKIESITVIKEKRAVDMYGEDAKDGVIIIKTKK